MNSHSKHFVTAVAGAFCALAAVGDALAGAHTWEPWIVFSNADGSIQFVALKEAHNSPAEVGIGSYFMITLPSNLSKQMHNVTGNTASRYFLLGTQGFKDLPGAPPVDETIPSNFVNVATDNLLRYSQNPGVDATWTAGTIPTNGIDMLTRTASLSAMVSTTNLATNYAGVTFCVDASGAAPAVLPGVPDGTTGFPVRVGKLSPDGSLLSISWDSGTCTDANNHQVVFGQRSGFPAKPGGLYTIQGAICGIGTAGPFTWTPTPSSNDGSGLTWFLVVANDGAGTEGPWGSYNGVNDRNGSGGRCSSGFCGTTSKSLAGTCGH